MHQNDLPELLKVNELKDFLRIGRRQAYKLCHEPDFPSIKIGQSIRIPKKSLIDWMNKQIENGKRFIN